MEESQPRPGPTTSTSRSSMEMLQSKKRLRVLRACDECKRKKKQCSGTHPCATCTRKSLVCRFSSIIPTDSVLSAGSAIKSPKRRFQPLDSSEREKLDSIPTPTVDDLAPDYANEDETPIQNSGRLLQDGEGRLLYLGDSATLSFLQSIRKLTESTLGSSPFTMDSSSHKILEASISTPHHHKHNYALPDLEAAKYLVDSFFANTAGLFHIFNKDSFMTKLTETYKLPLDADPEWLCQLNLVFAIGLQMRKHNQDQMSSEQRIIERLEGGGVKRAEIFFLAAKELKDPVAGIEDGGILVVQSLLLMTIYMLAASKRNSAWGYMGMAVTLAYALGIHKEETLAMFSPSEQGVRRNVWRSLYVMDCFLAASLGRPNAISCACGSDMSLGPSSQRSSGIINRDSNYILASVNASKIIGEILSRIYHKRKASRSIAYILSLRFSEWTRDLPNEYHWSQISLEDADRDLTLQRLHINLIYFHGIVLLTRPFLLYEIIKQLQESAEGNQNLGSDPSIRASRFETGKPEQAFCFHGACVRAAMHSINVTHAAFLQGALPRRDPFVIYWLFSAAVIVLANILCPVYSQLDSEAAVQMALKVSRFCSETDPQARRYLTILESFHDVLQAALKSKQAGSRTQAGPNIFNVLFGNDNQQVGLDESLIGLDAMGGISQNWVGSGSGEGRGQALLPESNTLYYPSVASDGLAGMAPWVEEMAGMPDDLMNFDGMWWLGSQDRFSPPGDMQVPLYGLTEQL